jgi:prepilin-type N-terminal cleavage/methylation domain-containing protein
MEILSFNPGPKQVRIRGFSLIESLLALALSLVMILAGIELFGAVRHVFFKLERYQSDRESVSAALEKIKADLQRAGQGFPQETRPGEPGIDATDDALTVRWLEDVGDGPEIRVVLYYFDTEKSTLRRKAGAGTAQPLLEGVGSFSCIFDHSTQMTKVEIRFALDPEKSYGLKYISKNMVFAAGRA